MEHTKNGNRLKIQFFSDLDAWKEGHDLALAVYGTTKSFLIKKSKAIIHNS
ncbi:MAG: hypothetical protein HY221_02715 [Candidatus Sungbacteria bacterium]|uniref:Uncharacterized protein n=1 Tax=Candidatus Sungiibacteriota bacterium TaxID=2750080 RepID=A0A932VSI7_9BACT|nr:hypothetical protein [Candidatus Sungbacteria bacterium]